MSPTNKDYRFLKACRREPTDRIPVWFMRQAGRYLPEYQELRKKYSLLEICKNPELAVKVTLMPLKRFPEIDAAILFSDLLLMFEPMGIKFEFAKEDGPVVYNPIRSEVGLESLLKLEPEKDLGFVLETIRILRKELDGKAPLIGFAGAPFTLASYMIEGGSSKDYLKTKCFMNSLPVVWKLLMEKLSDAVLCYLESQIKAGIQAVQVFDSWVGALSPDDYRECVLPWSKKIFDGLKGKVPTIHFGTNTAGLLELMKEAGGDVIGIDWRISIDAAWKRLGKDVAIHGNLDPAALLSSSDELRKKVDNILKHADRPGFIFNLGHGVLPDTPPDKIADVIHQVHSWKAR